MRIISKYVFVIIILFVHSTLYSQDKVFILKYPADKIIKVNQTYTSQSQIKPFLTLNAISGLAVSCDIVFNSDTSLVRIILVDGHDKEFLVCETYPLLSDTNRFSLEEYAEETALLNNIVPSLLKIEIVDATVFLKEIVTSRHVSLKAGAAITLRQQNLEKIGLLNENIKKNGGKWVAGETSISKLTFEEKKQLFGGKVSNLQGFDYYVGGIFVIPGSTLQSARSKCKSPYVDEFTWRNRHGKDWLTPVKNQGFCGGCWAFAATGVTELLVNLYFNRQINADLSEQQLVSCSGAGDCSAGSASSALDFIKTSGIIEESCFPYSASNLNCATCVNPSQKIRIGSWSNVYTTSYDSIKKSIIKGPVTIGIDPWHHVVTLAGYKTLKANDQIYIKSSTQDVWLTIPDGDPLVGQTAWLIKNSWGPFFGENGYAYIVTDLFDLDWIYKVNGPVNSSANNDYDILCADNDGDGYYTWGIGSKPAQCPPCPDEPDGDDSDPCLGPMNEFGIIAGITPAPIAKDVIISEIEPVPYLTVQGNNIRWYKDEGLDTLVCEGISFSTGLSNIGIYKYFVTQTISNCESLPYTVNLSILPLPPAAKNVTTCPGKDDIIITAAGQNIKWYSNRENPIYDDRDRQTYNVVTIGDQIWMSENLNYYTPSGSWYYDNKDSLYFAHPYGRLYNWQTAQEVCPVDWHLPSRNEWMELRDYLGGEYVAGGKMKDHGFVHWDQPNSGATNESGFTAVAGGLWETTPTTAYAEFLGKYAAFVSSENNPEVWCLSYNDSQLKLQVYYYDYGFSIRCLRYLSQDVASGNKLNIVYKNPGTYTYYVTQTINGIESPADTVLLKIIQIPEAPLAENILLCEGEKIPNLNADGDNIHWYTDPELTNLVYSGNNFPSGQTQSGKYKYYATQTIEGCLESPADNVTLTINPIPMAPLAEDIESCEGHMDQKMYAIGENILWYSDPELTNVIDSGNSYVPNQTNTSINIYYITQTLFGCESPADTVLYTIIVQPGAPYVNDITICEGEPVNDLLAEGEGIHWYYDAGLTNLACLGNSFATGKILPGNYTYYVSQIISECESIGEPVNLNINPLPIVDLGNDSTIHPDQSIMLGPFENNYSYLWNNGSQNPYYLFSFNNLTPGSYPVSVFVTDTNGCINADTVIIDALPYTGINYLSNYKKINIFPNPIVESINIDFRNSDYEDIIIKIYNLKGEEINNFKCRSIDSGKILNLDLSHLSAGMYFIQIITNKEHHFEKFLKF